MFVPDAMDLSLRRGVSPDRIPEAIVNRFSFHLDGREQMDNRVSVRISPRQIRFFYYDHDYGKEENGKNKYDPNGITDNSYVKEVGFISLTRRKDTGNDILAFPQNINDLDILKTGKEGEKTVKYEDRKKIADEINECNKNWKAKFNGFPFADKPGYDEEKPEDILREAFRSFLRYCLLCFVYEFEDRGMAFGGSPIYDKVRDKLRESDVYNMLSAKLHYIMYLYGSKHYSQNQEKYTYYTQKFADCLMDKNLNKVIPSENYGDMKNGQGWFYDPEKELEKIMAKNREHKKEGASTLKETLTSKIKSFFYTKHAVKYAMTSKWAIVLFYISQICMFLFSVFVIGATLHFEDTDSKVWNTLYDKPIVVFISAFVVFLLVVLSGIFNRIKKGAKTEWVSRVINALFPRIIVAEAAAWLTIGIAEDLVKSMLWVEYKIWIPLMVVLCIVGLLIFGEAKQHSPYCKRGENFTKSLLVLNHSVFFALVLGFAMQMVFYDNLLKASNVFTDVVYKEHFDKVENYLRRLEDVDQVANEYSRLVQEYNMRVDEINGENSARIRLSGVGTLKRIGDTMTMSLYQDFRYSGRYFTGFASKDDGYHDAIVNRMGHCLGALTETMDNDTVPYDTDLLCHKLDSLTTNETDSIVFAKNMKWVLDVSMELKDQIQIVRNHALEDSYDIMMDWATAKSNSEDGKMENSGSLYIDKLVKDAKEKKCCRLLSWKNGEKNTRNFYPNLLILHTLIVLVLSFITQLIISDKSVTEPL